MLGGLQQVQKVHFSGIGGIGMSALARMFLHYGREVTGSDSSFSENISRLSDEGARVFPIQSEDNITDSYDLLVFTPALSADHPELMKAQRLGIPTISYPEALGLISEDSYTIAVSGTHGKTTTTAMLARILETAGYDPTVIVGSLFKSTDGVYSNYRFGEGGYFLVEACEYKRSFSFLHPDILVVTNIEEDHLDYYKDISDIKEAFKQLAERLPTNGTLVYSSRDNNSRHLCETCRGRFLDYSDQKMESDILSVPGEHNRLNAKAAIAAASSLGVSESLSKTALRSFVGTWRRFEYKGKTDKGALVFDDYAHHPREISATLQAAKESFSDKRIKVVFQPHLYSRLERFFEDFVEALSLADEVILVPVYQARKEKVFNHRSSEDLAEALDNVGRKVSSVLSLEDAVGSVRGRSEPSDVVVMMGAGDIYTATKGLLENELF